MELEGHDKSGALMREAFIDLLGPAYSTPIAKFFGISRKTVWAELKREPMRNLYYLSFEYLREELEAERYTGICSEERETT